MDPIGFVGEVFSKLWGEMFKFIFSNKKVVHSPNSISAPEKWKKEKNEILLGGSLFLLPTMPLSFWLLF